MSKHADLPMIVRSTGAGGFVRANDAFLDRVGFSEAELASQPFEDWIHAGDRPALHGAMQRGEACCEVRHRTADGASLPLQVRLSEGAEGAFVLGRCATSGAAAVGADAEAADVTVKGTLRKIAEIVEEQNPGYKCSILLVADGRFVSGAGPSLPDDYNNAIDGFAIGPTVGSCGTAIYWNVPVIVTDIQNDPLWAPFAALAKQAGVAACWSHPFVSKGGRVLGALALYSPEPRAPTAQQLSILRSAAQMTGLAVERGRAEEQLRAANEVKARFMANMSHEIRTPLNALIGITDALHEGPGSLPRSDVHLLREASEQLLELFTGVLELTEVRDRRGHDKVVNLPTLCEQVSSRFAATARDKGLQFVYELSDVPQWAWLDEWSFERVLKLLIHNAVKFTDTGTVTVKIEADGAQLRGRIVDTGCGIDLARLQELRQPFVQGDLSTTKEYSGFGLGLALGDLCMQVLGGSLTFTANEPNGTVVDFGIPIRRASAPAESPANPAPRADARSGLPVLVVEDNLVNSKVIARILERSGYECHFSSTGAEALQAVRQNPYDCILMDCQMPVMDGYEATRRIRELEAATGQHIPIIAVTANALSEDRDLCLQAGMDDYLKKPVRKHELVDALETYVGKASERP
ncbi:MAG: response regulator [Planctomycetota bacterium]